jgi:hypothetical protein
MMPAIWTKKRKWVLAAVTATAVCLATWWGTAVNDSITAGDRATFQTLDNHCHFAARDTLARIREIQTCVLSEISRGIIPHGESHEAADVLRAGLGECYDRARVIEKLLQISGFETRHVALYAREPRGLVGLAIKGTPSHALLDVKTSRGWMSVGSNVPFIGVTTSGEVVATAQVRDDPGTAWLYSRPSDLPSQDNIAVYGLWSRHGQFFPPYIPLPDISWRELKYNF